MPGLVPGIHVLSIADEEETWMARSSQVKPGHDVKEMTAYRTSSRMPS
jgi:hypothetical protein